MKVRINNAVDVLQNGFVSGNDILKLGDFAGRLTRLMSNIDDGCVALFEGAWGSGKTSFMKSWKRDLEKAGKKCIYIDCFENDYIDDPFEVVAGAILAQAKDLGLLQAPATKEFIATAAKVARNIAPIAAKVLVKTVTFGIIGSDEYEEIKSVTDDTADFMSEKTQGALEKYIEESSGIKNRVQDMRSSLQAMVESMKSAADGKDLCNLIIIVDELDRCKPDFALKMIEVLKHFFSVDGINFILVCQSQQLVNSTKKVYGEGIDGRQYLQKLYDFSINFDRGGDQNIRYTLKNYIEFACDRVLGPLNTNNREVAEYISSFALAFGMSIRQIDNFIINVALVYAAKREQEKFDPYLIPGLLCFKILNQSLYDKARNGSLQWPELRSYFDQFAFHASDHHENMMKVFEYHLSDSLDENDPEFRGWGTGRIARTEVIKSICRNQIERLSA